MRTIERIGFLVILFCTVALLERAGAQDGMSGMSEVTEADAAGSPISTSQLEITAPDGRVVMRLGTLGGGGGMIQVFNKNGKVAAQLYADKDNDGTFALCDAGGVGRAFLGGSVSGGYANFKTKSGKMGARIGGNATRDAGHFTLYGGGKQRVLLRALGKSGYARFDNDASSVLVLGGTSDSGAGFIDVSNADNKTGLRLQVAKTGGEISIKNPNGKRTAFLGCSSNRGNGVLIIAHNDGRNIVEVSGNDGGGYLAAHNWRDKRSIFLGAATGKGRGDGVLELSRSNGEVGVMARAYDGGSAFSVYDSAGNLRKQLR